MSDVFYEELGLEEPDHSLDLRTADTDAIVAALAGVLVDTHPDAVLVYGDTNSTAAGARAGVAAGIPVVHVEAGLRSGDLSMPEERNRIEVDRSAALLLCPDERSVELLAGERVPGRAVAVGDVMADAVRIFAPLARDRIPPPHPPGGYVVVTLHREANVERSRLARIVSGLNRLDEPVVLPAHPRTRDTLVRGGIGLASHVELRDPMGYLAFASAASQGRVIVTDSGGLQKEAYWYGVPCVTTRPSTEWVDTVQLGANVLVDDDPDALVDAVRTAQFPADARMLYGDGHAAERIAATLAEWAGG
jgi:UDP-N-acetylglucosamine 2-epimerase